MNKYLLPILLFACTEPKDILEMNDFARSLGATYGIKDTVCILSIGKYRQTECYGKTNQNVIVSFTCQMNVDDNRMGCLFPRCENGKCY